MIPKFEEERTAKFNDGIPRIYRIDALKKTCHDARVYKDYNLWFAGLTGMRTEMNSKFTKKEGKDKERPERDVADEYDHAIRAFLEGRRDQEVEVEGKKGKVGPIDIYEILYRYELWLEDMREKYKFGMPDEDYAGAALK